MENDLLNNMPAEKLGKLFPIELHDHNPEWISIFRSEKERITKRLGQDDWVRIEHIGSTAIPVIRAKPVIDILLEVNAEIDIEAINAAFKQLGYYFTPQPENPAPHITYMKGYSLQGFKGQAFHVHVRYPGEWNEVIFRDYLIEHSDVAKKYEELKIILAAKHKNNREAYTEAKGDFINEVLAKAQDSRL